MNKLMNFIFILLYYITFTLASAGDNSYYYQNCVQRCINTNCTTDGKFKEKVASQHYRWGRMLFWNCKDECQYECMWKTVHVFEKERYSVPKFHGKWPFVRLFGVQEPASAFSSILNLAAHIYMSNKMGRKFPSKRTPLLLFWQVFAFVCMNAWIWSTIFHTKDNAFTEFMDYACALSMVMSLFIASMVRIFHRKRKLLAVLMCSSVAFFVTHVRYLYSGKIDYDYNMAVNVSFGVAGSCAWLVWAAFQWRAGRRYSWRMIAFTLLSGATLSLELLDFPPILGTWDAHALWHLSTAPLPLLFYKYVIDDLHYLQSSDTVLKVNLKTT